MMRRLTTFSAVAVAFLISGCSDQPARATGPWQSPSLDVGVDEIRSMIQDLVPPKKGYRGTAEGSFGDLESAINSGGTGETEALAFQALMLNLYELGALTAPSGMTVEEALLNLLNVVFTYAGLDHLLLPGAPLDPNAEYVIDILTNSDYVNGTATVETNFGNAAMIVAQGDFPGPVILSIIEKSYLDNSYVFPLPPGIQQIAKVFEFTSSSELEGDGTVLSICDYQENAGPAPKWLLHDAGGAFAEKISPNATGHTCPLVHQTALIQGHSFWARGLNAAGNFVGSVLSPKPLYAGHSLAHAIIVDELSPWTVGEDEIDLAIEIVRVKQPGIMVNSTTATFARQGGFVFWLRITNTDGVLACNDLALSDVRARATTTSVSPNAVGSWRSAVRCEDVNGSSAWVIELANPRNNILSSGVIDVTVEGLPASPQLTYNATL